MSINTHEYRAKEGTTTQWEDIHSRHKTAGYEYVKEIKKAARAIAKEDWTTAAAASIETDSRARAEESDDSSDDDEMLDDEEDRKFMESYRKKRMMEMKAKRAREAYGDVYQLSRADYEKEMVEGSKDKWVILHLYQDSKIECRLLANHLRTIAARKKDVKFLKIVATDCIEDYPDRNCPTLIAYHEGKMQKQFVGLSDFGGKKMVADDLEYVLAQFGVCETDIETNPRITETIKDTMETAIKNDISGAY